MWYLIVFFILFCFLVHYSGKRKAKKIIIEAINNIDINDLHDITASIYENSYKSREGIWNLAVYDKDRLAIAYIVAMLNLLEALASISSEVKLPPSVHSQNLFRTILRNPELNKNFYNRYLHILAIKKEDVSLDYLDFILYEEEILKALIKREQ